MIAAAVMPAMLLLLQVTQPQAALLRTLHAHDVRAAFSADAALAATTAEICVTGSGQPPFPAIRRIVDRDVEDTIFSAYRSK
jgi:hypothetical protein